MIMANKIKMYYCDHCDIGIVNVNITKSRGGAVDISVESCSHCGFSHGIRSTANLVWIPDSRILAQYDPYFYPAAGIVVNKRDPSSRALQLGLRIGYNRAFRILDQMEQAGIIGPANGTKPREIFFDDAKLLNDHIEKLKLNEKIND